VLTADCDRVIGLRVGREESIEIESHFLNSLDGESEGKTI
jgi:hypothetical protein